VIRHAVSQCSGGACYPSFEGCYGSGAFRLVRFRLFFAPKQLGLVIWL